MRVGEPNFSHLIFHKSKNPLLSRNKPHSLLMIGKEFFSSALSLDVLSNSGEFDDHIDFFLNDGKLAKY